MVRTPTTAWTVTSIQIWEHFGWANSIKPKKGDPKSTYAWHNMVSELLGAIKAKINFTALKYVIFPYLQYS